MTVVLRVEGQRLNLDDCRNWIPTRNLEASWRTGEKRVSGKINTASGFTLLLSEGDTDEAVLDAAMKALVEVMAQVAELVRAGATAVVDCGLMVTGEGSQSVEFGREFLELLSRSGVTLIVSAYPCSD